MMCQKDKRSIGNRSSHKAMLHTITGSDDFVKWYISATSEYWSNRAKIRPGCTPCKYQDALDHNEKCFNNWYHCAITDLLLSQVRLNVRPASLRSKCLNPDRDIRDITEANLNAQLGEKQVCHRFCNDALTALSKCQHSSTNNLVDTFTVKGQHSGIEIHQPPWVEVMPIMELKCASNRPNEDLLRTLVTLLDVVHWATPYNWEVHLRRQIQSCRYVYPYSWTGNLRKA